MIMDCHESTLDLQQIMSRIWSENWALKERKGPK